MKSLQISLILTFSLLTSCNQKTKNERNPEAFIVDMDNCNSRIDIKLSDLIDSCNLIQLETTKVCVLDNYISNLFLGEKYIVINDKNGVYKFSRAGRFIRKIINIGRGPNEISSVIRCYYDEKRDILYFDDAAFRRNSFLYVYDVNSEKFLEPIQKCFPETWGNLILFNDSIIIGTLGPGIWGSPDNIKMADSIPYALFLQNLKGKFLYGIPSNKKYVSFGLPFLQRASIKKVDNDIQFSYPYDDTLFKLIKGKVYPFIIPVYKRENYDLPNIIQTKIGQRNSLYDQFENSSFIIFKNMTFIGTTSINATASSSEYKICYYCLNKLTGKYSSIESYSDDFIGKIQKCENKSISFPLPLANNRIYVTYLPHDLIKNPVSDFTGKYFSESTYSQLTKIKSNLRDTDNPILLIGYVKNKILIP